MMTIREAIKIYNERKSKVLNRDYLDVVNNTGLCIVIPLNNGINIFIDTHPEMDNFKEKYPLEMPNKNGIFKRISFEVFSENKEPVIPECVQKYICKSFTIYPISYYFHPMKERLINTFIKYNGGINEGEFIDYVNNLFEE